MRRRALEQWFAALAGCALAGSFFVYVALAVNLDNAPPLLEPTIRAVAAGHGSAPYQYRFLVPDVLVWLTDHTALSMAQAIIILDGTSLAIGAAVGFALLRRAGLGLYSLPVGLYCSFVSIGVALLPKPETILAFACVTVALGALARPSAHSRWWPPAVVWGSSASAVLVLLGCRTDLVFALAVGFAVRYRRDRDVADGIATVALAVAAVAATVALLVHFSEAHYPHGVGVVELGHNLAALPLVVAALFLLPALAPLVLRWRHPATAPSVRDSTSASLPLLAVIATEVAGTLAVGRLDEVRLLFPVAFVLAWVGADLWRAVIGAVEWESAPVA